MGLGTATITTREAHALGAAQNHGGSPEMNLDANLHSFLIFGDGRQRCFASAAQYLIGKLIDIRTRYPGFVARVDYVVVSHFLPAID